MHDPAAALNDNKFFFYIFSFFNIRSSRTPRAPYTTHTTHPDPHTKPRPHKRKRREQPSRHQISDAHGRTTDIPDASFYLVKPQPRELYWNAHISHRQNYRTFPKQSFFVFDTRALWNLECFRHEFVAKTLNMAFGTSSQGDVLFTN